MSRFPGQSFGRGAFLVLAVAACARAETGDGDSGAAAVPSCSEAFDLTVETLVSNDGGVQAGYEGRPCVWDLPAPAADEDRSRLGLLIQMPPASYHTYDVQVADEEGCASSDGDFYLSDGELTLCPSLCRLVGISGARVRVSPACYQSLEAGL